METNRVMAELLSFALACDQTRVFSMMFSDRISGLRQPGSSAQHHQLTHDEPLDPEIGYQPEATEFVYASMEAWPTSSSVSPQSPKAMERCSTTAWYLVTRTFLSPRSTASPASR